MPGMSSPTGAYSRRRRPIPRMACLMGSPMPWQHLDLEGGVAQAQFASRLYGRRQRAHVVAGERGPHLAGFSSIVRASFSYMASVSGLCVNTGTGQPSWAASTVS